MVELKRKGLSGPGLQPGEICSPSWWRPVEKPEGTDLPQIPSVVSEGRFSSVMFLETSFLYNAFVK